MNESINTCFLLNEIAHTAPWLRINVVNVEPEDGLENIYQCNEKFDLHIKQNNCFLGLSVSDVVILKGKI
jgi:hypothetical protein